ncbi:MAG: hypothetical protein ACQ9MH_10890 [Nitrospinales bacterium]
MPSFVKIIAIVLTISIFALAGKYLLANKDGSSEYANKMGNVPEENQSAIKELSTPVLKNEMSESSSELDRPTIRPVTDEEKVQFMNKIYAAYAIKDTDKRKKAFINLFYLEGVTTKMLPRYENSIVGNLMMVTEPKISFGQLPKNFSGGISQEGKDYIYNIPELGDVTIQGVIEMKGISGKFPAKMANVFGRKGDELFFAGFVPR